MVKKMEHRREPFYGVEPRRIREEQFSPSLAALGKAVFALANGYIGIRGGFEEGLPGLEDHRGDGTYLAGFFEAVPISYFEKGFGYALNSERMIRVAHSGRIELFLEDEPFSMTRGEILGYERTLDLDRGHLARAVHWRSPGGREARILCRRLASFHLRQVLAFSYEVTPLNFNGPLRIKSFLDGSWHDSASRGNDPRLPAASSLEIGLSVITNAPALHHGALMVQETRRSRLSLACAVEHCFPAGEALTTLVSCRENEACLEATFAARTGEPLGLEKFAAYFSSPHYPGEDLCSRALETAAGGKELGFVSLAAAQEKELSRYWSGASVAVQGDPQLEQGLNFNLFHLHQAAGEDSLTGIGAKGLTGEGYEGHVFWDMEIYMVPYYALVDPPRARRLLEYRYGLLAEARRRALELSHPRGALYPWRTMTGEEGSSYFPAGTAQYHINAAIAYAVAKYMEATGDEAYLAAFGAEVVLETARVWYDLGNYVPRRGNRFCFHEVTGPDEYTAMVNNNCYTNLMARWHLQYACHVAGNLERNAPRAFRDLVNKIGLESEELAHWSAAAENVYVPYDQQLGILPQDDSFLHKKPWDFSSTPPRHYPLLLHYHPLVIYRHQVCKQPDVILAHYILADCYDREQKRRDYDYYAAITTHDSSLSPSVFGIIASEIHNMPDAEDFFRLAARLDLDNLQGDTVNGVHVANMAGSWLCLSHGLAGMRTTGGRLSFRPSLPRGLEACLFRTFFRGSRLEVFLGIDDTRYRLLAGPGLSFQHYDQPVVLDSKQGEVALPTPAGAL